MSEEDRIRWDRKHAERKPQSPGSPAEWLIECLGQLPRRGRALDLAAGTGRNSLLLASRGWKVTAVDISEAGFAIGKRAVGPLPIEWVLADLDEYVPEEQAYDLVLCFGFLDRARLPWLLERALKPGGLLLAETYNWREAEQPDAHIQNPDYLIGEDEWPTLLPDLQILVHDQTGTKSKLLARRPEKSSLSTRDSLEQEER